MLLVTQLLDRCNVGSFSLLHDLINNNLCIMCFDLGQRKQLTIIEVIQAGQGLSGHNLSRSAADQAISNMRQIPA
jgi:hypothetical protein